MTSRPKAPGKTPVSEQDQVVQLATARPDPLSEQVRSKLQHYLQRAVDPKEVKRAYLQWMPDLQDPGTGLTPEIFDGAFDWLFLGYRNTRGVSICATYAVFGDDLSDKERQLLAMWALSSPGFFRVEKGTARGELRLTRLPDGQAYTVIHKGSRFKRGMLITAWLLPTESGLQFGHAVGIVEGDIDAPLSHLLGMEMDLFGRQNPNPTWDSLYRELWPRLQEDVQVARVLGDVVQYCNLPKGPSVRWDGVPLDEEAYHDVEALLVKWAPTGPPMMQEPEPIIRLWWDGVLALKPKVEDPHAWAAAVLHAYWHRTLGHPQMTEELLAFNLKAPTKVVIDLSQKLAGALKLAPSDLRYTFLLDGWVRQSWRDSLVDACYPALAGSPSPTTPVKS